MQRPVVQQPKWQRNHRTNFITEIGATNRDIIDSFYANQAQRADLKFQPIGVPQVNGKFQVYANQTHLVGFNKGVSIPMSMEFYVDYPYDSPLRKEALATYRDPIHQGDEPPFYVTSCATGNDLITTYHHDKKGYTHLLANTMSQPTFMSFSQPIDDLEVHYTMWTRYNQGQDELPAYHSHSNSFRVQVLDAAQPEPSREAEIVERVRHKLTKGVVAHTTLPHSIDIPERPNDVRYIQALTRKRWSKFADKVNYAAAHLNFITDFHGFLPEDYTWGLISAMNQACPKAAAAIAVLIDYYAPTITPALINAFLICCGSNSIPLPNMSKAIQAYHHHKRPCQVSLIEKQLRGGRPLVAHQDSPIEFENAIRQEISTQLYPQDLYNNGIIQVVAGPAYPPLPQNSYAYYQPPPEHREEDWDAVTLRMITTQVETGDLDEVDADLILNQEAAQKDAKRPPTDNRPSPPRCPRSPSPQRPQRSQRKRSSSRPRDPSADSGCCSMLKTPKATRKPALHWKKQVCLTRPPILPDTPAHQLSTAHYKKPVWRKLF